MKKVVLAILIPALSGVTSAVAADLRLPAPPGPQQQPLVAAMPSWAGPYLGAQAGYLSAGGETTFPGTDEFHFVDPKGFAGGFMAGTARQWGRIVGGVEGDLSFVAAKATLDTGFAPDPSVSQLQTTINWNSHLRGRLGYGFDNALLFVAGGLALAGVENKAFDDTRVGWTIGGGVDYRVAPKVTVRLEYLYDNYGSKTLAAQTVGTTTFAERDHKLDTHTLRAGLNWHF